MIIPPFPELLLLLSIFFFRFPPIYFLGISNVLLTTEALAILIILLELVFLLPTLFRRKRIKPGAENLLILLFFFSQSISVMGAGNIIFFIHKYWKILLGMAVFIVVKYSPFSPKSKFRVRLMMVLVFGGLIYALAQLILLFYPSFYAQLGGYLIYSNVFNIIMANSNVGKIVDDTYFEAIVPILVYYYLSSKKIRKLAAASLLIVFGFVAFASNLRYRFLVFIFSLLISVFILGKLKRQVVAIVSIILIFILLFIGADVIVGKQVGFSVIDRFDVSPRSVDYASIDLRFRLFGEAIDMARTGVTGVGLGNFYDSLPNTYKSAVDFGLAHNPDRQQISLLALLGGTHNIFFQTLGETGFLGLFSLIIMLIYFLRKDIPVIKSGDRSKKVFICCFWTLMAIAQFFPAINPTFYVLFFLFRALI